MNEVILQTYDNEEFLYTYQILEDEGAYKVWKSTGPINGGFINKGESYDTALDAMQALVEYIKKGE